MWAQQEGRVEETTAGAKHHISKAKGSPVIRSLGVNGQADPEPWGLQESLMQGFQCEGSGWRLAGDSVKAAD